MQNNTQQDDFKILKEASAEKVGRSRGLISYQLGRQPGGDDIHIRITKNNSGGYFGKAWVPAKDLIDAAENASKHDGCFPSRALQGAMSSRCNNDPPFFAAVLLAEKLSSRCPENPSKFRLAGTSVDDWAGAILGGMTDELAKDDDDDKADRPPADNKGREHGSAKTVPGTAKRRARGRKPKPSVIGNGPEPTATQVSERGEAA